MNLLIQNSSVAGSAKSIFSVIIIVLVLVIEVPSFAFALTTTVPLFLAVSNPFPSITANSSLSTDHSKSFIVALLGVKFANTCCCSPTNMHSEDFNDMDLTGTPSYKPNCIV